MPNQEKIESILEAWEEEGKGHISRFSYSGLAYEIIKELGYRKPPDRAELGLLLMNTEFADKDIDRSDIGTFYLMESGLRKILALYPELPPKPQVLTRDKLKALRIEFRDVQGQHDNWSDFVAQKALDDVWECIEKHYKETPK